MSISIKTSRKDSERVKLYAIDHISLKLKNVDLLNFWQEESVFYASQGQESRLAGPPLLEASACGPRRLKALERLQAQWLPSGSPAGPECFFYATFEDQQPENTAFACASIWLPQWQVQKTSEGTTLWVSFLKKSPPSPQALEELLQRFHPKPIAPQPLFKNPPELGGPDPFFEKNVAEAIQTLKPREKVVLSRQLTLPGPQALALPQTLLYLQGQHPQASTFALVHPKGEVFVGATPERLLTLSPCEGGSLCVVEALGGSAPLGAAEGQSLLSSAKEGLEHALIVEFFLKKLRRAGLSPKTPESPRLLQLSTIQHLQTFINTPCPQGTSVLKLAHTCFPSPAVCGSPQAKAKKLIHALEGPSRGLYTGLIGWQNAAGHGTALVPLRCATWTPGALRLYAGAGILKSSDPVSEKSETDRKLGALGCA